MHRLHGPEGLYTDNGAAEGSTFQSDFHSGLRTNGSLELPQFKKKKSMCVCVTRVHMYIILISNLRAKGRCENSGGRKSKFTCPGLGSSLHLCLLELIWPPRPTSLSLQT